MDDEFYGISHLLQAYEIARKSRKDTYEVYLFDQNREERLLNMQKDLKNNSYKHSEYKKIIINDSKKRYIYSPNFQDHILHHLVYAKIYNELDKKMVQCTFACRKGYGNHAGMQYLRKLIRKEQKKAFPEKLYYLKVDFSKYFFSINHEILKKKVRKYIFDTDLLRVIDLIIESYQSPNYYDEILKQNIFYTSTLQKGLPIGGILSQLLANFYLNDFDQFLKHTLKVKFVRYMDDVVIFGTKEKIQGVKNEIFPFVFKEKLILNPKKISFNQVKDGVNFIGYRCIDGKIYLGKRAKMGFLNFMDRIVEGIEKQMIFSYEETKKIESKYYSRKGTFSITDFGMNYVNKRGNIEFLRGGNANILTTLVCLRGTGIGMQPIRITMWAFAVLSNQ